MEEENITMESTNAKSTNNNNIEGRPTPDPKRIRKEDTTTTTMLSTSKQTLVSTNLDRVVLNREEMSSLLSKFNEDKIDSLIFVVTQGNMTYTVLENKSRETFLLKVIDQLISTCYKPDNNILKRGTTSDVVDIFNKAFSTSYKTIHQLFYIRNKQYSDKEMSYKQMQLSEFDDYCNTLLVHRLHDTRKTLHRIRIKYENNANKVSEKSITECNAYMEKNSNIVFLGKRKKYDKRLL